MPKHRIMDIIFHEPSPLKKTNRSNAQQKFYMIFPPKYKKEKV